jgi:hypothetical protein
MEFSFFWSIFCLSWMDRDGGMLELGMDDVLKV